MGKFLLGGLALLGFCATAAAADLPVKAPPPAPVPLWSWAGFYLGIDGGYSFGHDTLTQIQNGTPSATASAVTPQGGLFGGQVGVNWQFGHLVLGAEGDAQWTRQAHSSCTENCFFDNTTSEYDANTVRQRLDWFATARARLGWANDGYLFYVTGGPAWGKVSENDSLLFDAIPAITANFGSVLDGWALGAGIEVRLAGNWSAKFEYLHLDLGTLTSTNILPFTCSGVACAGPYTLTTSSAVRDDIIRAGLNYQIAALPPGAYGATPWPAVHAAPARWSGLYFGINGGYGVGGDEINQFETIAGTPIGTSFANSTVAPTGGLFGAQAGYNWQSGPIVFGVEGDMQRAMLRGTSCGIECTPTFIAPLFYTTVEQKLDWFATARGRLGFANDGYLFYLTGGGAFGGVKETDAAPGEGASASFSQSRGGWTVGAGLEAQLWGNWSGKLEYLHLDLGNTSNSFTVPAIPSILYTSSTIRDDIVRAGLNYRLGG